MLVSYPFGCEGEIMITAGFPQSSYPSAESVCNSAKAIIEADQAKALKENPNLCLMMLFINNLQRAIYVEMLTNLGWQEVGASGNPEHQCKTTVYLWIKRFNQPDQTESVPVPEAEPEKVKPRSFKDIAKTIVKKANEPHGYRLRSILLNKRNKR